MIGADAMHAINCEMRARMSNRLQSVQILSSTYEQILVSMVTTEPIGAGLPMLAVAQRRFNVTATLIASAWHVVVPCTRAFTVFSGQPARSRLAPARGSKTRRARARAARPFRGRPSAVWCVPAPGGIKWEAHAGARARAALRRGFRGRASPRVCRRRSYECAGGALAPNSPRAKIARREWGGQRRAQWAARPPPQRARRARGVKAPRGGRLGRARGARSKSESDRRGGVGRGGPGRAGARQLRGRVGRPVTEEEGRGGKTVERMPPPAMDDPARSHVAAVAQPQSRQTRLFAGDVRAHFALGRTIGKGSFGKVKAAVARMPLELERGRGIGVGAHVAVKLVEATGWTATQYDEFYRECFLLAQVEHANVVRLIAVYKNARKSGRVEFAMVTELATGGELFDRIQRVGRFSERAASRVVRKLLGALSYLHARGIAHRDIKVVASLQSVREEHAIALAGAHGRARRHGQVASPIRTPRLALCSQR